MSDSSNPKSSDTVKKDETKSVKSVEKSSAPIRTDETLGKNPKKRSLKASGSGMASLSPSDSLMIASSIAEFKKIKTNIEDIVANRNKKDKSAKPLVWATRNLKIDAAPCSDSSDNEKTESICSDISDIDEKKTESSQHSSASDPSKELYKLVESITSKFDTDLNLLAEVSTRKEKGSEDRSDLTEASGITNPQPTESVGDPIKLLAADPQLFKRQVEAEIKNVILEPLCDPKKFDKNDPELLADIKKFSMKRRSHLQKLVEECKKVKAVMLDMNKKRHENSACKHELSSCKTTPLCWSDLLETWDETFKGIDRLMKDSQKYIKLCYKKANLSTRTYDDYVNVIIAVLEDISELFNLCDFALDKYRCVCYLYDDYHFLLYVNCFNIHLLPLLQKVTAEFEQFTQFDEELDAKIQNLNK